MSAPTETSGSRAPTARSRSRSRRTARLLRLRDEPLPGEPARVQKAGAAPVVWLQANNPSVEIIDSFDISSNGRSVVETSAPGGGPSKLVVFQNNGTPPDGNPVATCVAENFSAGEAFPRWSPDASQIAWRGAEGIYVSPAPVAGNGTCMLQPKLVGPGGTEPSWGLANAPAPPNNGGNTKKNDKKDDAKGGSQGQSKKMKKRKKKKRKK